MADGAALRDESRRLDSEKICSMFEGQNHTESQGGTAAAAGESDPQVLDSFGRSIQTDVVDRRDNPVEDTVALKANLVTSPVRDSGPDRSGCPDVDGAVPSNDSPPPPSHPPDVLTVPSSFD